jgi:hypothetical protein
MSNPIVLLIIISYSLGIYLFTEGTTESKQPKPKSTYKYDTPKDWAEDSTLNRDKRDYIEYLYNRSK